MTRVPYTLVPYFGRTLVHSVTLNVQLSRAGQLFPRTYVFEVLVDSGASRCLFPAFVAEKLGLVIEEGTELVTQGINGPMAIWVHDVTLHIGGDSVVVPAGFSPSMTSGGLLGLTGFFSNFNVTFDAELLECRFERINP